MGKKNQKQQKSSKRKIQNTEQQSNAKSFLVSASLSVAKKAMGPNPTPRTTLSEQLGCRASHFDHRSRPRCLDDCVLDDPRQVQVRSLCGFKGLSADVEAG
jgi:hypothetical protein